MTRIRSAGTAGLLIIALAACAQTATVTPSPNAPAVPGASGSPSSPAAASASRAPSALPALEALIPDKVEGMTLEKTSMRGSDFLGSSDADPASVAFLQSLGVAPADIGVAFGFGFDPSTNGGFAMFVFQATGADEAQLIKAFTDSSNQHRSVPLDWQGATLGGKHVQLAADTEEQNVKLYLYAHGDVLFLLSATSESVVPDALGKLP
jgi:hypothetical protein